ncbi:RagB/SusD family nutrient uptake outer membrane protein, partial [Desulfonatronum sp. SC1]
MLKDEGGFLYDLESYAGSAIKKYVIGTPEDNPGYILTFMSTPLNTYMMRLAEVYLIAAEAILGNNASTTNADALNYVNAVRARAGLDEVTSLTWIDILNEKRIELAFEGRFWGELVRWSYFDQSGASAYVLGQNRGHFNWEN